MESLFQLLKKLKSKLIGIFRSNKKILAGGGAITFKDNSQFIGAIGFNYWQQAHRKAEIGFWLMPEFWKKGVIKEVLPAMITFGFQEMKLHRIEAEVESENSSSKRVLEASGFRFEGTKRDCEIKSGRFISLDLFSLLENEIGHRFQS